MPDTYPTAMILRVVAALTAHTSERGGTFRDSGGFPIGCALSPLLGAFYLRELDARLGATGLFFVRFMDDIRQRAGSFGGRSKS